MTELFCVVLCTTAVHNAYLCITAGLLQFSLSRPAAVDSRTTSTRAKLCSQADI